MNPVTTGFPALKLESIGETAGPDGIATWNEPEAAPVGSPATSVTAPPTVETVYVPSSALFHAPPGARTVYVATIDCALASGAAVTPRTARAPGGPFTARPPGWIVETLMELPPV